MDQARPLISIGVPVFNGGNRLIEVFEAILSQDVTDYEVVISDNASTDATQGICQQFLPLFPSARYYRQPTNIGAVKNFEAVLRYSVGRYFMWAAADDWRSSDYLRQCLQVLSSDPGCIAATTPDRIANRPEVHRFELRGSLTQRILLFLREPFDSYALFYSLMHTDVAKQFDFRLFGVLGGDWIFIMHLCRFGEIRRTTAGMSIFSDQGLSHSDRRYSAFRRHPLHWLLPFMGYSRYVLRMVRREAPEQVGPVAMALLRLNRITAMAQFDFEAALSSNRVRARILRQAKKLFFQNAVVNRLIWSRVEHGA